MMTKHLFLDELFLYGFDIHFYNSLYLLNIFISFIYFVYEDKGSDEKKSLCEAEVKSSFSTWAFIAGLSGTHSCSEIILLKWLPASFSHEILSITAKGKSNAWKTCGLHYRLCILLTDVINVQIWFYIILNTTACHHFIHRQRTWKRERKRERERHFR